jgi:hypothetical protein
MVFSILRRLNAEGSPDTRRPYPGGWAGPQRNLDLRGKRSDGSPVNMKTLGRILSAALLCLATVGIASAAKPDVVPLGNDTFSITRQAKTAFTRDTDKLKADATAAAQKFCDDQGKQMRVLSLTGKVPMFSTGYASATIIFKALNAGDPGLTSPLPSEAPAGAPGEKSLTSSTDDLYNALLKLDDLRKKGILTDEEFQAEKKKILSHSN